MADEVVVEVTEIDMTTGTATDRGESQGAGVRQEEEGAHQGDREVQATVAVHLHDGNMVAGDDAARVTQATVEAGVVARAEIVVVEGDRGVHLDSQA